MSSENWKIVKELLNEILEAEPEERSAILRDARVSEDVRREVQDLIAFESEAEDLMQLSAAEFSKDFIDPDTDSPAGSVVGNFLVIREIGHGGMGAVYLAERSDGKFEQKAALKLLRREMNTSAVRRHFEQEAEILAAMEHPNIARLLDAGTTADGIPYIAMEYVDGIPIDEFCERKGLGINERLAIFRTVCGAVSHAHKNLIVHRDLKPSNILITDDGTPKLLDFGISKILGDNYNFADAGTITRLGVMTPSYASPEQLQKKTVTTATDIYSLGVLLYELLSGRRPFEEIEDDLGEIYRSVIEKDAPPPSVKLLEAKRAFPQTARPAAVSEENSETVKIRSRRTSAFVKDIDPAEIRGDIDNIVLKALRKEPDRRYLSAESFSDDLKRYSAGLPVTARPNTFSYRTEKFLRRNRLAVIAAAFISVILAGGILMTLWQARVAQIERERAERRFDDVRALANSFIFEFDPLIEKLPGSTPARKLLVTRALEYLDNLSNESSEDVELRRELARAYEKVGDLQADPLRPNIGDTDGGKDSYQKAIEIRKALIKLGHNDTEMQTLLSDTLGTVAIIHTHGGMFEEAEEKFKEAFVIKEQIAVSEPTNYENRSKMAFLLRHRGGIPFYQGNQKDAIAIYEKAIVILEQLVKEEPEEYKHGQLLANLNIDIGESMGWTEGEENIKTAGEYIQKGIDMLIPLVSKHPNDTLIARSLTVAYLKRGENFADNGNLPDSLASYTKGVELVRNSIMADPLSFQSKRDLVIALKQRSRVYKIVKRNTESIADLKEATDILNTLRQADQNNIVITYDLAGTQFEVAQTLLEMGQAKDAAEIYNQSSELCKDILEINPQHKQSTRVLANALEGKGRALAKSAVNSKQETKLALESFEASLKIYNELQKVGEMAPYDKTAMSNAEKEVIRLRSLQ